MIISFGIYLNHVFVIAMIISFGIYLNHVFVIAGGAGGLHQKSRTSPMSR